MIKRGYTVYVLEMFGVCLGLWRLTKNEMNTVVSAPVKQPVEPLIYAHPSHKRNPYGMYIYIYHICLEWTNNCSWHRCFGWTHGKTKRRLQRSRDSWKNQKEAPVECKAAARLSSFVAGPRLRLALRSAPAPGLHPSGPAAPKSARWTLQKSIFRR